MKCKSRVRSIISVLMFLLLFSIQPVKGQDNSSNSKDDGCAPLVRKHHAFHRLIWSGVFPVEGGFIKDPHCLSSEQMAFSDPVLKLLGSHDATYQVMDVNPFFNDHSSEIVFLVRSGGMLFEYILDFPKGKKVQAVLAEPTKPSARVFPYKGKLAILANFYGLAKGVYVLDLPLKSSGKLQLTPLNSSEFDEITQDFRTVGLDPSVKDQFCRTTNDFAAFYEKFAGPCGSPHKHTYDDFWQVK